MFFVFFFWDWNLEHLRRVDVNQVSPIVSTVCDLQSKFNKNEPNVTE